MKTQSECIYSLEKWFNKKLTPDQFASYAKGTMHIPLPDFAEIVDSIIINKPPMPSKFPTLQKIGEEWEIYKKEHPEKLIQYPKTPCKSCRGTGYLCYLQFKPALNRDYSECCLCGDCDNWKHAAGRNSKQRRRTKSEVESDPQFRGFSPRYTA